jgi:hypothetical protein
MKIKSMVLGITCSIKLHGGSNGIILGFDSDKYGDIFSVGLLNAVLAEIGG